MGDSLSSASPRERRPARLVHQRLHSQGDILRDGGEEAPVIPGDGVARHAESFREFLLGETESEPQTTKLPGGQLKARYLREHLLSIEKEAWRVRESRSDLCHEMLGAVRKNHATEHRLLTITSPHHPRVTPFRLGC